jgi:hypothetical protein
LLIWAIRTSYDRKRDFSNFQIEDNRQDLLMVTFSNGHNFKLSMENEV